jgi:hypothetical protein
MELKRIRKTFSSEKSQFRNKNIVFFAGERAPSGPRSIDVAVSAEGVGSDILKEELGRFLEEQEMDDSTRQAVLQEIQNFVKSNEEELQGITDGASFDNFYARLNTRITRILGRSTSEERTRIEQSIGEAVGGELDQAQQQTRSRLIENIDSKQTEILSLINRNLNSYKRRGWKTINENLYNILKPGEEYTREKGIDMVKDIQRLLIGAGQLRRHGTDGRMGPETMRGLKTRLEGAFYQDQTTPIAEPVAEPAPPEPVAEAEEDLIEAPDVGSYEGLLASAKSDLNRFFSKSLAEAYPGSTIRILIEVIEEDARKIDNMLNNIDKWGDLPNAHNVLIKAIEKGAGRAVRIKSVHAWRVANWKHIDKAEDVILNIIRHGDAGQRLEARHLIARQFSDWIDMPRGREIAEEIIAIERRRTTRGGSALAAERPLPLSGEMKTLADLLEHS